MKQVYGYLIIIEIFVMTFMFIYISLFGDNGRFIRDYGFSSSHISDNEVKGIWCGMQGFDNNYSKINGIEYCGNQSVKVNCKFTNKGDHCIITKIAESGGKD